MDALLRLGSRAAAATAAREEAQQTDRLQDYAADDAPFTQAAPVGRSPMVFSCGHEEAAPPVFSYGHVSPGVIRARYNVTLEVIGPDGSLDPRVHGRVARAPTLRNTHDQYPNVLPLATMGPMAGPVALLASQPIVAGPDAPRLVGAAMRRLIHEHLPVFSFKEAPMQQELITAARYRVNGIFVVETDKRPTDRGLTTEFLESVDQSLITAHAGPLSLRLVRVADHLYVLPNTPAFACRLWAVAQDGEGHVDFDALLRAPAPGIPSLHDMTKTLVWSMSRGRHVSPADMLPMIEDATMHEELDHLLCQADACLPEDEHKALVATLTNRLADLIQHAPGFPPFDDKAATDEALAGMEPAPPAVMLVRAEGLVHEARRRNYMAFRAHKAAHKLAYQKMGVVLMSHSSRVGLTTIANNAVVQQRKNNIDAALERTQAMTHETLADFVVDRCVGVQLAPVLPQSLIDGIVRALGDTNDAIALFIDAGKELAVPDFDEMTAGSILEMNPEVTMAKVPELLHPCKGASFIVYTGGHDDCSVCMLPIPTVVDGQPLHRFVTLFQDQDVQDLRILLNHTIVETIGLRDYHVDPRHKNMRRYMGLLYLWAAGRAPIDNKDRIRSLVLLAACCAHAGQNPASLVPQILCDSTRPPDIKDAVDWQLATEFLRQLVRLDDPDLPRQKTRFLHGIVRAINKYIRRFINLSQGKAGGGGMTAGRISFYAQVVIDGEGGRRRESKFLRMAAKCHDAKLRQVGEAVESMLGRSVPGIGGCATLRDMRDLVGSCHRPAVAAAAAAADVAMSSDAGVQGALLQANITPEQLQQIMADSQTLEQFKHEPDPARAMACIARLCGCPPENLMAMCDMAGLPVGDVRAIKVIFEHVLELVVAHHTLGADDAEIKILTAIKEHLV